MAVWITWNQWNLHEVGIRVHVSIGKLPDSGVETVADDSYQPGADG